MKEIMDNFSTGAGEYAIYRPGSPDEVFEFLYRHVPAFDTAWDCGTGNGQVAARLAERFGTVYGTDISTEQLKHAVQKDNIIYKAERAEQTSLAAGSIDLITIAQAIHWFDFDHFYQEVRRVARPGALIAAWTYSLFRMTPSIDAIIDHFYDHTIGAYWDKERQLIDEGYRTIPFPFEELKAPEIWIVKRYTIAQLLGYLRTWSASRHYIDKEGQDPTLLILPDLQEAWGSASEMEIRWPVHVRAGYVR